MEEVSFPRGGRPEKQVEAEDPNDKSNKKHHKGGKRKSSTPLSQETVKTDFLFGNTNNKEESNHTKKRKVTDSTQNESPSSNKHSLLPLGGGGVVVSHHTKKGTGAPSAPVIEAFGFSKMAKGTKVLAVVREVQDEFAVVSLPNLLTAYVLPPKGDSNASLKRWLSIGQTLAVVVQRVVTESVKGTTSNRRRIQVSALPQHVNPRDTGNDDITTPSAATPFLRGQILSVEDHGCLIDLGFGRKGFVKFQDVQGKYVVLEEDEDADADEEKSDEKSNDRDKIKRILQTGRLYDFTISAKPENSIYSLALPKTETLAKHVVMPSHSKASSPYTLASITPGWMVTAKVESLAKNGLCVTFLGNVFRGAIEMNHLGGHFLPPTNKGLDADHPWKDIFGKHQHFSARIVAVDVPTKLIRLSLAPHLLELKKASSMGDDLPDIGTIVDDCTVVRVDAGIGALLALPAQHNQDITKLPKRITKSDLFTSTAYQEAVQVRAAYVHISKALDEQDAAGGFGKEFAPGTSHPVRILSTGNWMDGVASGACAPSILKAHVLTHADLKPGQVYKQVPVCAQLQGGSMLVQLGGGGGGIGTIPIRGLIPPMHLLDTGTTTTSDYRRKLVQAKFAVDAKVDVRVLWVDAEKKKCLVSAKKSLVKADDSEMVRSYEGMQVGQTATGFISKMDDHALYVTFCNRVYGKVTARSLAAELGMENHTENYKVGDVVTCRVVKLKKRDTRKKSSPLDEEEEFEDDEEDTSTKNYWEVTLSLKVQAEDGDEDTKMEEDEGEVDVRNPKQVRVRAGAVLPLKSMKIVELVKGKRKDRGGFVPGYAIVSIKSKHLIDEAECDTMLSEIECKLPYDQLLDEYDLEDIETVQALDAMAERVLTVGKKINQKGIILTDPHKSNVDYSSGIGRLTVVSIRKNLIQTAEKQYASEETSPEDILLPAPDTHLFVGALVQGYIAQVDARHGSFIRFLDGMTGLIPRTNGGLDLSKYDTIVARVLVIDDTVQPMRIMLEPVTGRKDQEPLPFKRGDKISQVKVSKIRFFEASLKILDDDVETENVRAVMHCTMKESPEFEVKLRTEKGKKVKKGISEGHPFFGLKKDHVMSDVTVISVQRRNGKIQIHLTDRSIEEPDDTASIAPAFVEKRTQLKPGMVTSVVIVGVGGNNKGLHVQISPFLKGFVPGLELSTELGILNDLQYQVPPGKRIKCRVMDHGQWHENRAKCPFASQQQKSWSDRKSAQAENPQLFLSVISCEEKSVKFPKPTRGDLIIGRINKILPQSHAPSLMLGLRGGFVGRCCITELDEPDEWENMPLGRTPEPSTTKKTSSRKKADAKESMDVDEQNEDSDDESDDEQENEENQM
jgi:ribosomal protein S1